MRTLAIIVFVVAGVSGGIAVVFGYLGLLVMAVFLALFGIVYQRLAALEQLLPVPALASARSSQAQPSRLATLLFCAAVLCLASRFVAPHPVSIAMALWFTMFGFLFRGLAAVTSRVASTSDESTGKPEKA